MTAELLDELPDGWVNVTIPDVCELNPSKPKAEHHADTLPVTFVPMPAVDADAGAITKPSIRTFGEVRKGFTSFRDHDVILAKITPCMENGKAAVARGLSNGLGFGSTEFHVFRSNGAVLPDYLFRFIRQASFRRAAEQEMTGSVGQKRVPAEYLEAVELPLPPLAEQRRIVAAVEAVLAKVNAARDRLNRVPSILKRFRQAVLSAACSGQLTTGWREKNEVGSWTKGPLGDFCKIIGGSQPEKKHFIFEPREGYIRLIQIRDYKSEKHLTYVPRDLARRFCSTSDVMIGRYGPPLFQILRGLEGAYNVALMKAVPKSEQILRNDYLFWLLQDPPLREDVIQFSERTAGQDGVRKDLLEVYEVNLPPLAEQQEIVRRVEELFALADVIETRLTDARQMTNQLTQAVLAKAFSGELVPTEAALARREKRSYEPAATLLARIRAEREQPTATTTKPSRKSRHIPRSEAN